MDPIPMVDTIDGEVFPIENARNKSKKSRKRADKCSVNCLYVTKLILKNLPLLQCSTSASYACHYYGSSTFGCSGQTFTMVVTPLSKNVRIAY